MGYCVSWEAARCFLYVFAENTLSSHHSRMRVFDKAHFEPEAEVVSSLLKKDARSFSDEGCAVR